jgi:hypothetical protein
VTLHKLQPTLAISWFERLTHPGGQPGVGFLIPKLIVGAVLGILLFVFMSVYWLIFTPPHEMVDCKIGDIVAVVTYEDCQMLEQYVKAKK